MKLDDLGAAIAILRPYYDDPTGYHVAAEHDVIYLMETDRPLTLEDAKKMMDLGWIQDDGANDDVPEEYNPAQAWQHCT
jgi:hypothetical protein